MNPKDFRERLAAERVLAIIRAPSAAEAERRARAVRDAGIGMIEVSWTTPDVARILRRLREAVPCLGAGTVLTPAQAVASWEAGAQFLVAPSFSAAVAAVAREHDVTYIPGVFTAQEVSVALDAGCTLLKLFPASTGGVDHLKALVDPFPGIEWIPTGGVTWENAGAWIEAGALAVGMGQGLFRHDNLKDAVMALRRGKPAWES
jgi:2-dehydro-3-deoxyphosphogluconate aldolase/(4S)-4-hydroxy-2-oxoglutarate aldolase